MTPSLIGKVALVTGGARRVGRAIALGLAEAGMDVAITYRASAVEAVDTVHQIEQAGRRAAAIEADLAAADAAERVFDHFSRAFDRLDALVNNAAMYGPTPWGAVTAQNFDAHMAVNARAPLLLTQRFAPMLAAHADPRNPSTLGRVVNLIDVHAMGRPVKGYAAYSASKAALLEITRSLARELAPTVTVNAIAPGVVAWPESMPREQREQYLSRVPMGRAGTPGDVAAAVVFLVRDAPYCTGQVICLDGGRMLA